MSVAGIDAASGGSSPDAPEAPAIEADVSAGPSLEEMDAMMQEGQAEGETPPASITAPAKPAAAPAAAVAEGEAVAEIPAPGAAPDVSAEAVKLRKGWAALARDKEVLVRKVNEANAIAERAKAYQSKAEFLDTLPAKLKADPLGFLEANGIPVDALLDRVIESEKSPIEKEIARMRQELADRDANQRRAQEEANLAAVNAKNQAIIDEWTARNTNFAKADPERYDLINSMDMGAAVHEACVAYHQKYNVILDASTAADYVEKGLRAGVQRSKFFQAQAAKAVAVSKPAPVKAPASAQPSNGQRIAPKQTGTSTTLSSVASGDGASTSTTEYPNESDSRMDAVLREMQAEGLLPDAWRIS